jgi:glycosyltransferase involved in cell wall biosynthesis
MARVLWFSNNAASGIEVLSPGSRIRGTGGWLCSLNDLLKDQVELHIAFHYPYKLKSFSYQNTEYHPIYTGSLFFQTIRSRFSEKVPDCEFLDSYLKVINEIKPDLIHIHGTENSFLSILNYLKIPVIISIQGNLTVYSYKFNSGFYGNFLRTKKNRTLRELLLGAKTFQKGKSKLSKMAWIENRRMKDIKYVIGRTDWDYRISRILSPGSQYFRGEELLRESFYKDSWNNLYTGGKLVVFTTNSDNYYKGIETVFYSITLLQSAGIDVEWRIAGIDGKSLIVSVCRKYLGPNFPKFGYNLLGSLDEHELKNELLNAHLYVMPSHIENSPNNLCEAMILGLPCIATFVGGTGSLLDNGKEGVLIQDGDPWAMSGAVIELSENSRLAKTCSINSRQRALKRHSKDAVKEQYTKIYNKLIEINK